MNDSIALLKECDSGLEMAITTLDQVLPKANANNFRNLLDDYYQEHIAVQKKIDDTLAELHTTGKKANPLAENMAKVETNFKLLLQPTDQEIANLMMDGCNMGIKSVSKYMNQYSQAQQEVMQLANDIITLEQKFVNELRQYL